MTFARTALLLSAGALCWAVHFTAIYAFTGIACARNMAGAVPWAVAAITAAAMAVATAILVVALRRRDSFEHRLAAGAIGLALVAIAWDALPALMVPACG